ncbi:MAG TPA: zinc-binding dehydrogenase [Thermoanaerobaculia bacterium]|nr:zinc-binding dehydrogenase [Thermoanaerobaculia bacterium]
MLAYRVSHHGGPEALELCEVPTPAIRADEVRVRVRACALNRLDLWVREGVSGFTFPLPLIPGSEVAGVVDDVGELVSDISEGDSVLLGPGVSCGYCSHCSFGDDQLCANYGILGEQRDGGYAEYIVVPGRNVLPLPAGLSFVEAAAIPLVFLTAWHMLVGRARLAPHEDILLHAAGSGVTTAGIQIARLLNARHIIVTAGSDEKLQRAKELGATDIINYHDEDFAHRSREITGGKGVEVVFDHVGGEIFERSFKAVTRGGRIVICGATAGHEVEVNLRQVFFKSLSVLGSTMGSLGELKSVLRFFPSGDLKPVVDRTFPFTEAQAAQQYLATRRQFGKVVLVVGDEVETPGQGSSEPEEAQE